jgi:hypothetical protein
VKKFFHKALKEYSKPHEILFNCDLIKQPSIVSPDSSGILLWRGSPQQIQRMAGGKVKEKMKRMLQENKKDCSMEQSFIIIVKKFLSF